MPKVNGKTYGYDSKGKSQAKAASKRTGKPMTTTRKKSGTSTAKKNRKYK